MQVLVSEMYPGFLNSKTQLKKKKEKQSNEKI